MNVTLFANRVFADDQVKMRSLEWTLIQHNGGPHEKGKFGNRCTHTGRAPCEDEGRDGSDVSSSRGTPRITSSPPRLGEMHGADCSSEPLEGSSSAETLICDIYLQNSERMPSLVLSPRLVALSYSSPGNQKHFYPGDAFAHPAGIHWVPRQPPQQNQDAGDQLLHPLVPAPPSLLPLSPAM